ncbi:PREDICTED: uncharacterized protein LOC106806592 [Priapulus caudatus]|uniref:Uncharacterized protein LOC106806592 n=1 Tax=Priapulus caudatus TaxID=37621 RepID=A0ABM1DVU9_PRICU|nr:PREDICTED: uncharacterized protein LOC106806592 [Priapulus caudatus]
MKLFILAAVLVHMALASSYGQSGGGVAYPGTGGNYYGDVGSGYALPDQVPYGITGPLIVPYTSDIHKRHHGGYKHGIHDARNQQHSGNYYKDNGAYNDNTNGRYYNNQYNLKGRGAQFRNNYLSDFNGKHLNNNYVKGKAWGHSQFAPTAGLYYRKLYSGLKPIYW